MKKLYRNFLTWRFERKFKKWCKFIFHHALYPITIDKDYLKRYIDFQKEWKKKYGVDLLETNVSTEE